MRHTPGATNISTGNRWWSRCRAPVRPPRGRATGARCWSTATPQPCWVAHVGPPIRQSQCCACPATSARWSAPFPALGVYGSTTRVTTAGPPRQLGQAGERPRVSRLRLRGSLIRGLGHRLPCRWRDFGMAQLSASPIRRPPWMIPLRRDESGCCLLGTLRYLSDLHQTVEMVFRRSPPPESSSRRVGRNICLEARLYDPRPLGSTPSERVPYQSYHSIRLPSDPGKTLPASESGRDLPVACCVNGISMRLLVLWVPPIM